MILRRKVPFNERQDCCALTEINLIMTKNDDGEKYLINNHLGRKCRD